MKANFGDLWIKNVTELMLCNYNVARENMRAVLENVRNVNTADPCERYSDLAITYRLRLDSNRYIKVTRDIVTEWEKRGYNTKFLHEDAMECTKRNDPLMLQSLPGVLSNMFGYDTEDGGSVFVVSTQSMVNGAIALFYEGTRERVMRALNTRELIVIPSSIHEVLVLPSGDYDIEYLNQTVKDINNTQVAPKERLGDQVYRYNTHGFSMY